MMYRIPALALAFTMVAWRVGGARALRVMMRKSWPFRASMRVSSLEKSTLDTETLAGKVEVLSCREMAVMWCLPVWRREETMWEPRRPDA
jgi:hypothetical protein